MRKLLLALGFVALMLTGPSYLYGCGGEGGESNPDSDMLGDLFWGTLKMNSFTPKSQDYIPKEILNINIPTAKERANEKRKKEIQEEMRWQEEVAQREITMGNVQDVKVKLAYGTVIAAGMALAAVGGGAVAAGEMSAAGASAAGVGYSAAAAGANSAAKGESGSEILGKMARASIQSAIIGVFIPGAIKSGLVDEAFSHIPTSTKTATHMDGLKDYGPGHVDLANGQRIMK